MARCSLGGRSTTSKRRRQLQIGCMRRSPPGGTARSSSVRTTAGRHGSRSATSSRTTASRARISGTTGRSIRGSSRASGTSNRRSLTPTRCTPESRTRRSSVPSTQGRRGRSSQGSEITKQGPSGSLEPAGSACTRSSSTRTIRSGSSLRSRRQAPSARTTGARPGARSTAGCARVSCPTRTGRWGTASTASR